MIANIEFNADVPNSCIHHKPLYEEIEYKPPIEIFEVFCETKWNMLIDSADGLQKGYGTNRYSYILVDPFEFYVFHSNKLKTQTNCIIDPLSDLKRLASRYRFNAIEDLPPFQGGLAGYISYDLVHMYHPVKSPSINDLDFPEMCFAFYDLICAFDHSRKKAYIISSGFPEVQERQIHERATKRINWFKDQIVKTSTKSNLSNIQQKSEIIITSNFTKDQYINAVEKVVEYIKAGDIFEANLTQRFEACVPDNFDYYNLYKKLSIINPSPFAAYINLGEYKILSASPERFIKLHDQVVETRPIKGTRRRSSDKDEDNAIVQDLINSEKDFSENIMIVDLMRNDLSIVCDDNSVIVPKLCGHEIYPTVHHLVSVILGKLRPGQDAFSLLKASFPGGSITGAPKIRAMQIISEIEPHSRGPYCGSVTLIGFDGNMDTSIVIRTYVIKDNHITFHAGGAIVIDSNPLEEYEETLSKSYALRIALTEGYL